MVLSFTYRYKNRLEKIHTRIFKNVLLRKKNKQHQRVLCNEIRRLPSETIKQLAVRIAILVRKAYSLNTRDNMNRNMTEKLMMTLTPQLQKVAKKESFTSIFNTRTQYRHQKTSR